MLLELLGHSSSVFTVDISDDKVISGDKDEALVWSLADGNILRHMVDQLWQPVVFLLSVTKVRKNDSEFPFRSICIRCISLKTSLWDTL